MPKKSLSKRKKNKDTAGPLFKSKNDQDRKINWFADGVKFQDKLQFIILAIMLIAIALLLVIGPFQRGLFFPRELLQAQIFVFALLIVWGFFRIVNKDSRLIESPLDICLLILLAAYLMSFFIAVHKRDALEELLKIGSYIVVYLVALDICRHWRVPLQKKLHQEESSDSSSNMPPGLNLILHLLLVVATVITLASLGVAAGHLDFVGAYAANRIASPMGYANTAAAYLMAAYFLNLGLATLVAKSYRALYLAPAALMLMTVVLTFSRGAWLLLPPLALLFIIASAPGQRLRSLLYMAATGLAAVPAALLIDPVFRSETPAQAWILIIFSILLAVIMGLLVELYLNQGRKVRVLIGSMGLILFTAAAVVAVLIPLMGPVYLERDVSEKAKMQSHEQVIENVDTGQTYQLSMEINAKESFPQENEKPDYIWGVQILGGLPGYKDEELLDYRGTATDGWEEKVLTFQTGEETTRLTVKLYNGYPGTSFAARSVVLSSPDRDQRLRFAMSRILPDRYYNRIYSYSRDRNIDRRLEIFEDAVKVIRDYPVLGAGGGAWDALYRAYQDHPYHSREVHNHYLQVWIEAGVFGFLAFAGIWISLAAAFIRNCLRERASPRKWQYWTAVFLPATALGAHSVIDWNFSMAAVGMFLFVLLGAGRSLDQVNWFKGLSFIDNKPGKGTVIGVAGLITGLFLSIYSVVLLNGLDATWDSQRLMERGNITRAMSEMDRAIRLDPFRAENYHNLSVLIEDQARRRQSAPDTETILYLAKRAYDMEPYNPTYFVRYGDLLMTYVDIDEGLSQIDRLIKMRPHSEGSYIRPAFSRLNVVEYYIDIGNKTAAEHYAEEIFELEQKMKSEQGDRRPLAYIIGRTHYLLGRQSDAEQYYEAVKESDQFYEEAQSRLAEMHGEEVNQEGE